MYNENDKFSTSYTNEYKQQIKERQQKRAAMRRKRLQRQRIVLCLSISIVIIVLITIVCIIIFKSEADNLEILSGVWKYDEYTQYEFDGTGNGCMCIDDVHYKYTYSVSKNKLILDFEDNAVHDCTYTFMIDNTELTLVGEEGTVGGTYNLVKQ